MHLKCRFTHYCLSHSTAFKHRSRKNIRLVYIVCVYVMCMCWKDEVGIIHTHDSIPYKLLDKGFRFFFYSSLTHPLLPPFFFKASFDFDPTLHHERHLCQRLCPPRSPAPPLLPTFYPDLLSSLSNCWLSPAALQSAWKNTLTVGKKFIHPVQAKQEKEGTVSSNPFVTFSLTL